MTTAQKRARSQMLHRTEDAERMINDVERLARRNGIKITVNLGAEIAHTHDALAELAEYIRKL